MITLSASQDQIAWVLRRGAHIAEDPQAVMD
jgi:hypothetical protein